LYGELKPIKTNQGTEVPAFPVFIQNPAKFCCLRIPNSEEILAYTGTIRELLTSGGGRRSTEEKILPNPEAERKLFEAIRLDPTGDEFDSAEMLHAIENIMRQRPLSCEREGDQYVVKVGSPLGNTVHTCHIPTTRQLHAYRDGIFRARTLPHGIEERRFPPSVPVELYDAIIASVDGYSPQFNVPVGSTNGNRHVIEGAELKSFLGQIPPHHKRTVATEVTMALNDLDPAIDPNE
jgi:hypothetical protein